MIETDPQQKKARIMVVDDDPATHALLTEMLVLHGSEMLFYPSGAIALMAAENHTPDLVLLAVKIPDMDGFEVCKRIKQNPGLKDVPVIFLSDTNDTESKVRAFEMGGVDYITKPIHFAELRARVAVHLSRCTLESKLEFQKRMEEKIRELSEAQQATIFAIAKLAEQRDEDTGAHLERVREYCRLLAERLGEDSPYAAYITAEFVECIQHASPLHDIGKVAIPDSILLKPHKLTSPEFEVMKTHAVIGAENMQLVYNHYSGNVFIGMGIEIALYHHERWDGSGYPDGLTGRNIPLPARIMALADCYDALRSDRCYRRGLDHERVKAMILEGSGTHFDPEIVKAFLSLEEEFSRIQDTFC
ncbi:MAG: response regulator [Deltaproteobacteria bacterium]|nr:response regulator [Deltaproteobacteria bacterium]